MKIQRNGRAKHNIRHKTAYHQVLKRNA